MATSFGERVPNASPVDGGKVNGLGFMLADKNPGEFKLEVAWVKIEGPATPDDNDSSKPDAP